MSFKIQARLDDETRTVLERLQKRDGLSASQIVRKGIHLVARESDRDKPIQIIGLGEFDSGIPDLATNKKHLAGLGRKSRPAIEASRRRRSGTK